MKQICWPLFQSMLTFFQKHVWRDLGGVLLQSGAGGPWGESGAGGDHTVITHRGLIRGPPTPVPPHMGD